MSTSLINELKICLTSLKIHTRQGFYLKDFLSLLTEEDFRFLLNYDAETAIHSGAFKSRKEYLFSEYGIEEIPVPPTPVPLDYDQRVDLVSQFLFSNVYANGFEEAIRYIVNALNSHLAEPKLCAQLISQRSLLKASRSLMLQEAHRLKKELKNYKRIDFEKDDWKIVAEFRDTFNMTRIDLLWREYKNLYKRARVESRHPLFATKYSLYIPPIKRLQIADPIEQIILESARNPSLIHRLTPREFEQFLAKIFEGFGYEVQLTSKTRDGGADILCMTKKHGIPIKVAVEAKRYHSKPIGVKLVRQFVGANRQLHANKLVYVTTSRYTPDAARYASLPLNIELLELKELPDIIKWTNEFKQQRSLYIL